MKRIATLILLTLICVMGYAQTIDMALEKEMGQRMDDEKINVFVIMKQQYDQEKLGRRADGFTTRAERKPPNTTLGKALPRWKRTTW